MDPTATESVDQDTAVLPRPEVVRRLRERLEPVLLFGETELDAFKRLRESEISGPEVNRGFRNDFQAAMDQVDQAFLDEILKSQQATGTNEAVGEGLAQEEAAAALAEDVSYEQIQEMARGLGKGHRERDAAVILTLLEFLLRMWSAQLNSGAASERMATKAKIARATHTQTRVYMKPLLRKLRTNTLPEDILDSLTDIARLLLARNYIKASDAYLQMAIGT